MAKRRRRKGSRSRGRGKRRASSRKGRRRGGKRRAARGKGRSRSRRSRGSRHRPTLYKSRGKWYRGRRSKLLRKGTRINGRRRRRSYRRNPLSAFKLPTVSGIKDILKIGAGVGVGYVGVNVTKLVADKFFLANFKAGKSPTVVALINFGVGALLGIPLAGMIGKAVLGGKGGPSIYAGAAFNVVQHLVIDLNAAHKVIPDQYAGLLLDFDAAAHGMFDYVGNQSGVNDYLVNGGINEGALPTGVNLVASDTPDEVGAFI